MTRRIVAHLLQYPPHRRIGAELATHALLAHLAGHGWEAIACPHTLRERAWAPYELDSVTVARSQLVYHSRADVVLYHLPYGVQAARHAKDVGGQLVCSVHGGPPGWAAAQVESMHPDLVIANSETMATSLARTAVPVQVLRPPVWPEDHAVRKPGNAVTLVNLTEDKGSKVFFELARRLPDVPFLGVTGGYAQQESERLPNVTVLPHGTPMREVWSKTRLLVMPSVEESWGMVAVEAMASGIPVIGSLAPGLLECLGGAMPTVDARDIDGWTRAVRGAYYGAGWERLSVAALRRSAELDPTIDLLRMGHRMAELAQVGDESSGVAFRNVRTGHVAVVQAGSPMHARLVGKPLVWHPIEDVELPEPDVPKVAGKPPAAAAGKGEWVEYAVARGADRRAAEQATKKQLNALYGE